MKIFLTTFIIFQVLSLYGQTSASPNEKLILDIKERKAAPGKPFPVFLASCEGKTVSNETLKGKTVWVNFWVESCSPCIAEFDALNEAYEKLKDNKNFEFISFTFEKPERIEGLRAKYKIQYKIISIDRSECYRLNQNNGFPTNLILDKDQTISYLISGGNTNKDKARTFIMNEFYPKVLQKL